METNNFIKSNPDWEERLAAQPYSIKIKRKDGFVLLKYNQYDSDFMLPLVRECRGIILDESDSYRPVCVPFFKFGNFGESYVPEIDWQSASVQEKIDGSLIKLWNYKGIWHVSSNGEIDASDAYINNTLQRLSPERRYTAEHTNLYTLFMEAWERTSVQMKSLDENFTYMFELTSPVNRVVVKYNETSIRHIGTRDMRTLRECDMDIGIAKPKTFSLKTLDDCIESAKQLGYDEEGYVVVDRYYNRVKIKSPQYVTLSHLTSGISTHSRVVEILQKGEREELLTYFPEYSEVFEDILSRIAKFSTQQDAIMADIRSKTFDTRKDLAAVVTKTDCPACLFALYDGKASNAREWLMSRPADKILRFVGLE